MKVVAVLAALFVAQTIIVRGYAVDCDLVRGLSRVERAYYIVRYDISKHERQQIKRECRL